MPSRGPTAGAAAGPLGARRVALERTLGGHPPIHPSPFGGQLAATAHRGRHGRRASPRPWTDQAPGAARIRIQRDRRWCRRGAPPPAAGLRGAQGRTVPRLRSLLLRSAVPRGRLRRAGSDALDLWHRPRHPRRLPHSHRRPRRTAPQREVRCELGTDLGHRDRRPGGRHGGRPDAQRAHRERGGRGDLRLHGDDRGHCRQHRPCLLPAGVGRRRAGVFRGPGAQARRAGSHGAGSGRSHPSRPGDRRRPGAARTTAHVPRVLTSQISVSGGGPVRVAVPRSRRRERRCGGVGRLVRGGRCGERRGC